MRRSCGATVTLSRYMLQAAEAAEWDLARTDLAFAMWPYWGFTHNRDVAGAIAEAVFWWLP